VIEKNRLAWRFHQLEPVAGTPKVSPKEDDFEALPNGRPQPAVTVIHPQTKVTASLIDGKTLVFLKPGGEIHQHPQQDCPEPAQEIHWSPDAFQPKLFVIARKGHGYLFDLSLNSWQQLDEPHAITTGAFSSDGSLLAVGTSRGKVSLWDVATNQQISFSQKLTGAIEWLRWNRSETLLAYQSNGSTGLLMVSSPFERGTIPSAVKSASKRFSWASSGNFYVVQENSIGRYALSDKGAPRMIKDREGIIACVALAPTQYDPESLLLFKNDGNIYQIDPIQNKNLRILPNRLFDRVQTIKQIFLHPKEHLVLIAAESKEKKASEVFYLIELSQPEAKVRYLKNLSEQNPTTLTLDPLQNLAYLSLPTGEIVLWNLDLDERATKLMNKADVNLLAVDSTGKTLAFSTSAGQLGLLDLATKATRWEANHEGAEITVLHWYHQDLISAGTDRTLRIWDGSTGMPLGPTRKHPVIVRQLAHHGKLLGVSGEEGFIRVWKLPF
jgi:WD40 repeat protein